MRLDSRTLTLRPMLRLALTLALLLAGCSRVETPKITAVVIHLNVAADTAVLPLLQALTDAYTATHSNVTFSIQSGSATAVADMVYAGQVDMAAVSLLPVAAQGRQSPWVADLAMDGVAVVVNPANPLETLTMQELRDIFAGVRSRWSDVGVAGLGEVDVAVREAGDGARAAFDRTVMGSTKLSLDAVVLPTIEVAMNYVAYQANAIAYVPSARITQTVAPRVKVLGIEGQKPTRPTIADGGYRLSRTLNLIALAEPQGELRQFVAWATGAEGQAIVDATNYVPISPNH